jgi:hypothetical protein
MTRGEEVGEMTGNGGNDMALSTYCIIGADGGNEKSYQEDLRVTYKVVLNP